MKNKLSSILKVFVVIILLLFVFLPNTTAYAKETEKPAYEGLTPESYGSPGRPGKLTEASIDESFIEKYRRKNIRFPFCNSNYNCCNICFICWYKVYNCRDN